MTRHHGPAGTPARLLRDALEPFHGMCYYVPELRSPYVDELGLHPWSAYFGQRAAAMGAVGPEVVVATFFGFSPRLVAKSIPSVWRHITPADAWAARISQVGVSLRRLLGEPDRSMLEEAAHLSRTAREAMDPAGHPLGAAHATREAPDDPMLELWRDVTALREHRGDGHVAALVTHGVGPIESLATSSGFSNLSISFQQRARGWSEDEWRAGVERCRAAGWIDADGALTDTGRSLRSSVEDATDRSMSAAVDALGDEGLARLTGILAQLSRDVVAAGGFPA